jgi:hypothetical protein
MSKQILLLSCLIFLSLLANAQAFEGEFNYSFEVKGEQAEMVKAFMPSSMKIKVKGTKSHSYMEGGMSSEILTIDGQSYMLDREAKTAQKMPKMDDKAQSEVTKSMKAVKTNEKKDIASYPTEKYIVTSEESGKKVTMVMWMTTKIEMPIEVANSMFKELKGIKDLKGVPLKVEIVTPASETDNMTIEMTVTSIKKGAVTPADLELPKDFKITAYNAQGMGGMMGR